MQDKLGSQQSKPTDPKEIIQLYKLDNILETITIVATESFYNVR